MKFTKLTMLLLFLFCAPVFLPAQTTCPSGYTIAQGFKVQDPTAAVGTFIVPLCISGSTGTIKFQGDMVIQTDITPKSGSHLALKSADDNTQVRINSRNYTQTTGSSIGFQVKPAQTVTTTGNVIGGEISPRYNSGIAGGSIIGLHVDAFLKGTAAGTLSGDVRGIQIELITDDAGTRTIDGYVTGLRFRSAFSATGITGNFTAFRVEKPELQTNSQTYDALFELTSTIPLVWNDDPGTELPGAIQGYIKVIVNGATRFIALYTTAPTD